MAFNFVSGFKAKLDDAKVSLAYQMAQFWAAEASRFAARDTGFMISTIGFIVHSDGSWQGYCDAPYALDQEFGTRFMPAHPFMRPALLNIKNGFKFNPSLRFTNARGPSTSTHPGNAKVVKSNAKVNRSLSGGRAGKARILRGHERMGGR